MVPSQKITLTGSHGKWDDCDITFMIYDDYKIGETQMHRMHKQRGELYDVPTCCMKVLKI